MARGSTDAAHTAGCVQDNLCLGQKEDGGKMKRCQDHTDTNKEQTCGATSWAVGCRLAGRAVLCCMLPPSRRKSRCHRQEDKHKRLLKTMLDMALLLLSAQLPSEARLTLLNLSVGESALAKLIMRPNWWQQRPRSTGLERRSLSGWPSLAESIAFCSSYSGKILLPHCLETFSCYTTGKEPPQAPTMENC